MSSSRPFYFYFFFTENVNISLKAQVMAKMEVGIKIYLQMISENN